ncbi:MAG TPA: DUF4397 domain-containing protein [Mucilaginibacter sp.]|nr:DUF4397 domain-containing protein [Mucilaginibacter sp.]
MKTLNYKIATILMIAIGFSSCKKDNTGPNGGAALNIVNVMPGTNSLVTNFNSNLSLPSFSGAFQLSYGSYNEFSGYIGTVPISFTDISDTTHTILKTTVNLSDGSIHTLFLTGSSTQPDTVYTTDHIPYYKSTDSVSGVRFVNLSPDSKPVSINIQGNANGSEIAALGYKHCTPFKTYPVTSTLPVGGQYVFEIRDANSGNLLTTWRF